MIFFVARGCALVPKLRTVLRYGFFRSRQCCFPAYLFDIVARSLVCTVPPTCELFSLPFPLRIACVLFTCSILGGLYYQRSVAQALTFFGLFLNSQMTLGFGNLSEMAGCVMTKYIAYR